MQNDTHVNTQQPTPNPALIEQTTEKQQKNPFEDIKTLAPLLRTERYTKKKAEEDKV